MTKTLVIQLEIIEPERTFEITLRQGLTSLGREPGNDIQLNFPKVSRRHAHLECSETMCVIFDDGSANGTLVDGNRIPPSVPVPLNDNSVILIDPVRIICRHGVVERVEEGPRTAPVPDATHPKVKTPEEPVATGVQFEKEKAREEPARDEPLEDLEIKQDQQVPPIVEEAHEGPPPPPSLPERPEEEPPEPEREWRPPPGLSEESIRLLDYLPSIYHTEFMSHFMALFESILVPIEWNVDNFDVYLDPGTAPLDFLPWLSAWYDITFDPSWPEERRRLLLKEAHALYARRGTCWSLTRLLEIYTGQTPQILEFEKGMEPHMFKVILDDKKAVDPRLVSRLIDMNKPAHTSYVLEFRKR